MTKPLPYPSDVAFTKAVKAIQASRGSRVSCERMERSGGWNTEIDDALATFIAQQRSFFLATATAEGQPYIQHRGGSPGFLRVLNARTLAFADYRGNRQYISLGNLSENPKVHLFLIDYARQTRVKIWGTAKVIEGNTDLIASLMPEGYSARPEQAMIIDVVAWDANCPQHIPQRLEADDVAQALATRDERIAALEAEVRELRSGFTDPTKP